MKASTNGIRARHDPTKRPEEREGRLVFEGEVEWLIQRAPEDPPDQFRRVSEALGGLCEPLSDGLLLVNFGNTVGFFEIPGLGRIEVVSSKWDEGDYDRMLADLMEVATALPFAAEEAAALPYDRSVTTDQDILYHAFVYLRYVLSDLTPVGEHLLPALRMVLREPHRRFERVRRPVPVGMVRRVDAGTLVRIAEGREPLVPFDGSTVSGVQLAKALHGRMPDRVEEPQVDLSLDTPENRFVKTFLQIALGLIEGMRQTARRSHLGKAFAARLLVDCDRMEQSLRPVASHPMWGEIGAMVHLPVTSTVLQRRRGYKEVFGHFSKLRLATRVPLPKQTVLDLLEAKDIALLYELWCFFSLVRELEHLLGRSNSASGPRADEMKLAVPRDLRVEWEGGCRLLYNPTFSRSRGLARHSYSVPLRPDIVLEVPGATGTDLHLFDAKFRLLKLSDILPDDANDQLVDEAVEEHRGTFKRGDLYKMHTYRDAIDKARSVWVLYPGTEMKFFSPGLVRPVSTPEDLPPHLAGVGAIPLSPDDVGRQYLRRILSSMATASDKDRPSML